MTTTIQVTDETWHVLKDLKEKGDGYNEVVERLLAQNDDTEELINKLEELQDWAPDIAHKQADMELLIFIDDEDVTEAFDSVPKQYERAKV